MIEIPDDGWGLADYALASLLDGMGAANDGALAAPDWQWGDSADDDPVSLADSARERAGGVLQRQRSIGGFNHALDALSGSIADGADWASGLERYDREVESLRERHAGELRDPGDRDAFARHAGEFAVMQRIGLKRALVERQASEALGQLDEQLVYYAGKAAEAGNDVFRQIATDSGLRAIDELREAGYLTPESAETRKAAFLRQVDAADLETIVKANPEDANTILDDIGLFPTVDDATRDKIRKLIDFLPRPGIDPPSTTRTSDYRVDRDGPYGPHGPRLRPATSGDTTGQVDGDAPRQAMESLAEWPTEGDTTPPDMAKELAVLLGPALAAILATPAGRLIASRLGPSPGRALTKPGTKPENGRAEEPSGQPPVQPSALPQERLPKPPLVPPPEQGGGTETAPPYSPTKPIGTGEQRYKPLGNREFVQYEDGSIDFGGISQEIVADIAAQKNIEIDAAPVRLPKGKSNTTGELHMERGGKIREIRRAGYANAAELVDDIGNNFNEIWLGSDERLLLVKRGDGERSPMMFVELKKPLSGSYYEVKSGGDWQATYTEPRDKESEGLVLLWRRTTPSSATGKLEPLPITPTK